MAELAEGARLLSECGVKAPPRVRIPLSPPILSVCPSTPHKKERIRKGTGFKIRVTPVIVLLIQYPDLQLFCMGYNSIGLDRPQ